MSALLFQAVRDTLVDLLADPQYLGAQPDILTALHTWSQTLVLHPHLHCLVTGGGLTPDGRWQAVRHGFLLPARVVMAVVSGQDARRDPAGVDARGVGDAGGAASSAGTQSAQPSRPSEEDALACAHHGTLCPRGWGGDVSGPLSAGRSHQERPPRGVRRRPRHLHLSRAAGGRRGGCFSP